jgi:purine-binding chemotaxis protein CheW
MPAALDEHLPATAAPLVPQAPIDARGSADPAMPREFLSFCLGGEEYGIDILRVQEIRSYEPPTRIANAPPFIKGVVNLRGIIVPVVDLRLRLGSPTADYDGFTVTIVLNIRGRVVGAVVDSVSDVVELAPSQIRPAPELHCAVDARHIVGIGSVKGASGERMLILTDIDALLSSPETGLIAVDAH